MKKVIYSLAVVLLGFASCNTWEDEHSENYGDGPSVDISLSTTTDSTFTFTVNPATGTQYYSYAVVQADAAEDVSESDLLSGALGGVTNEVLKYADDNSVTVDMRNAKGAPMCTPNTSYVVYAVAANDKGITGLVKSLVVKTSDGSAPTFEEFATKDSATTVTFSENVALGTGTISATYYKEWDITHPVTVAAKDIHTSISGNNVVLTVDSVPAGAYVAYSWTEGAFVDSKGNKCPAMNSSLSLTIGKWSGVYVHLPNASWTIEDDNFTSPKAGSLVTNYATFAGTITFAENVYRNDAMVESGDIAVVYSNAKKTSTISLDPSDWSVSGNTVTFKLPEAAAAGDIITVKIKEGVIFDVFGNGNEAYTSTAKTVWWKYFAMTKAMLLGTFNLSYTSSYDDTPELYDGGSFTISESTSNANELIIKDFWQTGSEISATYDLNTGEVIIPCFQELGTVTTKSGKVYGLVTFSISQAEEVAFTVNPDGTMTSSDFAVLACSSDYAEAVGFWEKCATATFTPAASSAKTRMAKVRATSVKKVTPKVGHLLSRVRK